MQPIIDADTHIAESEAMWAMFDEKCTRGGRFCCLYRTTLYTAVGTRPGSSTAIFFPSRRQRGFPLVTPSASKIQFNRRDIRSPAES